MRSGLLWLVSDGSQPARSAGKQSFAALYLIIKNHNSQHLCTVYLLQNKKAFYNVVTHGA